MPVKFTPEDLNKISEHKRDILQQYQNDPKHDHEVILRDFLKKNDPEFYETKTAWSIDRSIEKLKALESDNKNPLKSDTKSFFQAYISIFHPLLGLAKENFSFIEEINQSKIFQFSAKLISVHENPEQWPINNFILKFAVFPEQDFATFLDKVLEKVKKIEQACLASDGKHTIYLEQLTGSLNAQQKEIIDKNFSKLYEILIEVQRLLFPVQCGRSPSWTEMLVRFIELDNLDDIRIKKIFDLFDKEFDEAEQVIKKFEKMEDPSQEESQYYAIEEKLEPIFLTIGKSTIQNKSTQLKVIQYLEEKIKDKNKIMSIRFNALKALNQLKVDDSKIQSKILDIGRDLISDQEESDTYFKINACQLLTRCEITENDFQLISDFLFPLIKNDPKININLIMSVLGDLKFPKEIPQGMLSRIQKNRELCISFLKDEDLFYPTIAILKMDIALQTKVDLQHPVFVFLSIFEAHPNFAYGNYSKECGKIFDLIGEMEFLNEECKNNFFNRWESFISNNYNALYWGFNYTSYSILRLKQYNVFGDEKFIEKLIKITCHKELNTLIKHLHEIYKGLKKELRKGFKNVALSVWEGKFQISQCVDSMIVMHVFKILKKHRLDIEISKNDLNNILSEYLKGKICDEWACLKEVLKKKPYHNLLKLKFDLENILLQRLSPYNETSEIKDERDLILILNIINQIISACCEKEPQEKKDFELKNQITFFTNGKFSSDVQKKSASEIEEFEMEEMQVQSNSTQQVHLSQP